MNEPELPWDEVSRLIMQLGSERHFAQRLASWRGDMSLRKLSKALEKAGHYISPTALSRIENMGNPARADQRTREITIGDALAISRVFNKSLVQMLLPDEALKEHSGWVAILEATEALRRVQDAWHEYRDCIHQAQRAVGLYLDLQERVELQRTQAEMQFREGHMQDWEAKRQLRIQQGDPVPDGKQFEQWLKKQPPTRELMALEDALADEGIDQYGWIKEARRRHSGLL